MKEPRRARVYRLVRRWWIVFALLLGPTCIAFCSGDDVTRPPARPVVTTTTLPAGAVGVAYSAILAASGGKRTYAWTLASGSLPTGLALSRSGTITGTPTAAGNFSFMVQVASAGASATRAFTLDIAAALQITSITPLSRGIVDQPYHAALTVTGGDASNQWSLAAGALPAGLTLSAAGVIAGTPTAIDTAEFAVRVANALGQSTTAAATLVTLAAPAVTTSSLSQGAVGVAYQAGLAASGGDGGYVWALAGGGLPAGVTLATDGTISGTPTAAGSFTVLLQVTSVGVSATRDLTLTIAPALQVAPTPLPLVVAGRPYSFAWTATGGDGANVWSLASGALPAGLTLSADGVLAGTATAAGTAEFVVRVSNPLGQAATAAATLVVVMPVAVTTTALQPATVGQSYSATLTTTGGSTPFGWSLESGSLPAGLGLSTGGVISGTPTAAGVSAFRVAVVDRHGLADTTELNLEVVAAPKPPTITITALQPATVGQSYTATLAATGGSAPFGWSVVSGSLPAGLGLSAGGVISGTPASAGVSAFRVAVVDRYELADTTELSLDVVAAPPGPPTITLASATLGQNYTAALTPAAGSPPFNWSLTSGSLPAGLVLSADGVLSGTPAAAGVWVFRVTVVDRYGVADTTEFSLGVRAAPEPPTITTTALARATLGQSFTATLAATGGSAPFAWSVVSGGLPAGLGLSADGVLSGTPTAAGTSVFRVEIMDRYGLADTTELSLEVVAAPPGPPTIALASATLGQSYTTALTAAGGSPPFSWSLTSGSLPAGLVLSADGVISGTPAAAGVWVFRVVIVDRDGVADTTEFSLDVRAITEPPTISTTVLAPATLGQSYTAMLAAAGGALPLNWSLTSGSLPVGLALSAGGAISGTPTTTGVSAFGVAVIDSYGLADTAALSLEVVAAPPGPPTITLGSATLGQTYTAALTAAGGSPPFSWSLTIGSLPAGLVLSASGVISGTPTAAGVWVFHVAVVDRYGVADTTEFTLEVRVAPEPPTITTTSLGLGPAGLGHNYMARLAATAGSPPLNWSVVSGSLPAGLVLGTDGVISGTPTAAGVAVFRIAVVDRYGLADTTELSLEVLAAPPTPPTITTTSLGLGPAALGHSYTATLAATGGSPPLNWSMVSGSLPTGLVLGTDGVISGTPAAAGVSVFRVAVVDRYALADSAELSLKVVAAPPGPPTPTLPNLKVAFIGDQGSGPDAVSVLQLIRDEGADMVIHAGDFDYKGNPTQWDATITSVLGANFPYFASVGNHDESEFYGAGGYQEKLIQRLARVPDATCTGDLGVNSTCRYQGLFFILSGAGTLGDGHESYLRQELAADSSIWRICSWHKNQEAMQVGGKGDEVGWSPYETCRELGAIIATGHEHSYSRTRTLVNTQLQTVDPAWPAAESVRVTPGATFVFVSGLGGKSIRDQERCLPTTFPYGCKGEWASIYTSNQAAIYGALFIEFHVNGDPNRARGYFKNIDGTIVDQLTIVAQPPRFR